MIKLTKNWYIAQFLDLNKLPIIKRWRFTPFPGSYISIILSPSFIILNEVKNLVVRLRINTVNHLIVMLRLNS